jgi:creatinine amidohydrolase
MTAATNQLDRLTWRQVQAYLESDSRLVFVLGATEQHGHLALGNDTLNALELATAAASAEGVLLAPVLPFGISTLFTAFPGTLSLRVNTFAHAVMDIASSAYHSGFRKLLFINGNGPHVMLLPHFTELMTDHDGLVCDWFEWFSEPAVVRLLEEIRPRGETHANWGENWPSSRPDQYAPPTEEPWWEYQRNVFLHGAAEVRQNVPSGSFGGPQEVPVAEIGRVIDLAVDLARQRLRLLGP